MQTFQDNKTVQNKKFDQSKTLGTDKKAKSHKEQERSSKVSLLKGMRATTEKEKLRKRKLCSMEVNNCDNTILIFFPLLGNPGLEA